MHFDIDTTEGEKFHIYLQLDGAIYPQRGSQSFALPQEIHLKMVRMGGGGDGAVVAGSA